MSRLARYCFAACFGIFAVYSIAGGVFTAFLLKSLLTPGEIDWSGSQNPNPPKDPFELNYRGDPKAAFGYDFQAVTYQTQLGQAEAWLVPAEGPQTTWAIYVHGVGGIRENGYKQLVVLHEAKIPTLLITYRNDTGAPAAPNHLYSFGITEWMDLDDAVTWAKSQGAERFVIVAESMGGAIAGQFLMHSSQTGAVAALALDAPALDFGAAIADKLARRYLPLPSWLSALGALGIRLTNGTDLWAANSMKAVADFPVPLFIAHGSADSLVPVSVADDLVARRTASTVYLRTQAEHLLSFKEDPSRYKAKFLDFLASIAKK
jgi:uncharacterized protein